MNRRQVKIALVVGLLAFAGTAGAQKKAADDKPNPPDAKTLQTVFDAFAPGLPKTWDSAWVVVREVRQKGGARDFAVDCMYVEPGGDVTGKPTVTCDRKTIFENIFALNRNLPEKDQRRWTRATLIYKPDGNFELKYGYEPLAEQADEKDAAKDKKK